MFAHTASPPQPCAMLKPLQGSARSRHFRHRLTLLQEVSSGVSSSAIPAATELHPWCGIHWSARIHTRDRWRALRNPMGDHLDATPDAPENRRDHDVATRRRNRSVHLPTNRDERWQVLNLVSENEPKLAASGSVAEIVAREVSVTTHRAQPLCAVTPPNHGARRRPLLDT